MHCFLLRPRTRLAFAARAALSIVFVAAVTRPASAQPPADLADASLETLLDIEITSGSRHEQTIRDTAAAAYVITAEDIRRSGATTIAELLRVVPGMDVARIDGHRWAVAARGFNGLFSNKLLVLLDGRNVYNPFFSGVHWDLQDTRLEDIDRIEVIRGPGAALWGVNAVLGVINVITKHSSHTQGTDTSVTLGMHAQAIGSIRHGGTIGPATFRVFAKGLNVGRSYSPTGVAGHDDWRMGHGGFRIDAGDVSTDAFTLQSDVYRGSLNDRNTVATFAPPFARIVDEHVPAEGANLVGHWRHRLADGSEFTTRAYVDHYSRQPQSHRSERATSVDLEAQHHVRVAARHDLVYGAGARWTALKGSAGDDEWFTRNAQTTVLRSAFAQDEILLVRQRLRATVGAKIEFGDMSGANFQPSARLLWTPQTSHTLWLAVARAVRTPTHSDRYVGATLATFPMPDGSIAEATVLGDAAYKRELSTSLDLGYRVDLSKQLSLDLAGSVNRYDQLGSLEVGQWSQSSTPFPHAVITRTLANNGYGTTGGIEGVATWVARPGWRLRGTYSWQHLSFAKHTGPLQPEEVMILEAAPRHIAHLQSWMSLPGRTEADTIVSYVSARAADTPAYVRVDGRFGWRTTGGLELSIIGQNLFDDRRVEFVGEPLSIATTVARRSLSVRLGWGF